MRPRGLGTIGLALTACTAIGCGKGEKPLAPSFDALAARACACEDGACATPLLAEFDALKARGKQRTRASQQDHDAYDRLQSCVWPLRALLTPPTLTASLKSMTIRGGILDFEASYPDSAPPSARYDLTLELPAAGCTVTLDDATRQASAGGSKGNTHLYTVSLDLHGCRAGAYGSLPFTLTLRGHGRKGVLARLEAAVTGDAATIADPWGPKPDLSRLRTELAALAPLARAGAALGACPDGLRGRVEGVDVGDLETWGGASKSTAIGWLRSGSLLTLGALWDRGEGATSTGADDDAARFLGELVLVYVPDERRLPVLGDKGFEAGRWTGHAVLVDRKAGKALCATALTVTSSPEVSYTRTRNKNGNWSDDAHAAVRKDFMGNFAGAIAAALKAVAPSLLPPDQP